MYTINTGKLLKTEEYNEEMGSVIFVSFPRDEQGVILGETPDVYIGNGYLEQDFDENKWTHFIDNDLNFIFTDVGKE